jgi:hypothetical protein
MELALKDKQYPPSLDQAETRLKQIKRDNSKNFMMAVNAAKPNRAV